MRKPKREGEPAPIREVLPSILQGLKGAVSGPLERLRKAWGEVLGPEVAARTRVAAFSDGILKVEVASAALKHDLATFRTAEALGGLRQRLPDLTVRAVSYRVAALR
ncbi:MAG: DUF721 domain-containing protein [Planctomycetes bacterium]|nr:DUF721 domain-containing protein [Planctomycetota bacterium]